MVHQLSTWECGGYFICDTNSETSKLSSSNAAILHLSSYFELSLHIGVTSIIFCYICWLSLVHAMKHWSIWMRTGNLSAVRCNKEHSTALQKKNLLCYFMTYDMVEGFCPVGSKYWSYVQFDKLYLVRFSYAMVCM